MYTFLIFVLCVLILFPDGSSLQDIVSSFALEKNEEDRSQKNTRWHMSQIE